MTAAKYRIKELPNGLYLLETAVPESKLWIHIAEFVSYDAAIDGMERTITGSVWYFNAEGDYLDKGEK